MHVAFSIDAWFVPSHSGEESFGEVIVPVEVAVDVELEWRNVQHDTPVAAGIRPYQA